MVFCTWRNVCQCWLQSTVHNASMCVKNVLDTILEENVQNDKKNEEESEVHNGGPESQGPGLSLLLIARFGKQGRLSGSLRCI